MQQILKRNTQSILLPQYHASRAMKQKCILVTQTTAISQSNSFEAIVSDFWRNIFGLNSTKIS